MKHERKTVVISTRVTPKTERILRRLAKRSPFLTFSEWLGSVLDEVAEPEKAKRQTAAA